MKSRKSIHKMIALLMAALVFLTSTGFTIDIHYCQDILKTFSFIGKAKSCQDISPCKKACHSKSNSTSKDPFSSSADLHSENGCCENDATFVKYNGNFPAVSLDVFPISELQTNPAIFFLVFSECNITNTVSPTLVNYRPPPIDRDISVLFQRFLC